MRTLHLLRHAKSSWDDPALEDHERPLARRGRRASAAIAAHLREEGIDPDLVLCSTAARTRETYARVSAGLGGTSPTTVEIEPGLYEATSEQLLVRLRGVPEPVDVVMLIGHQPSIGDLALTLAASGDRLSDLRQKFPTGALATLALSVPWGELRAGSAELTGFVRPRDLG